jgi:hypothetical protein
MVETVSAQPLPANTQGGIASQALEPGTELRAKVEANLPGGVVRLSSDAKSIDLRVPSPLPVGSNVTLSVSGTRQQPAVVLTPDSAAAKPATARAAAKHRSDGRGPADCGKSANSGDPTRDNCATASGKPSGTAPTATAGPANGSATATTAVATNRAAGRTAAAQSAASRAAVVAAARTCIGPVSSGNRGAAATSQPGGAAQPQLPGQILTQPAVPGQPAVPNQAQVPGQLPAGSVLPQPAQPTPPSSSGQALLPAQGAGTGGPVAGAPIISTGQGTVVPPLPSGGPAPGTPGAPVSAQSGPQTTVTLPSGPVDRSLRKEPVRHCQEVSYPARRSQVSKSLARKRLVRCKLV